MAGTRGDHQELDSGMVRLRLCNLRRELELLLVRPSIRLASVEIPAAGRGLGLRFEIRDQHGEYAGSLLISVPGRQAETMDRLIAQGCRQLASVIRSWAKGLEDSAAEFERR